MYSMATIFKYCIVYLKYAKRVDLKCSYHIHTKDNYVRCMHAC